MRDFDSSLVDISAWPSREFSVRATFRDTSIKFTETWDSDDTDSDFTGPDTWLDYDIATSPVGANTFAVARFANNELWFDARSGSPLADEGASWSAAWGDSDETWKLAVHSAVTWNHTHVQGCNCPPAYGRVSCWPQQ